MSPLLFLVGVGLPLEGEIENLFLRLLLRIELTSFVHSLINHSFNKYLLNSITVLFLMTDAEDMAENNINMVPASRKIIVSVRNKH